MRITLPPSGPVHAHAEPQAPRELPSESRPLEVQHGRLELLDTLDQWALGASIGRQLCGEREDARCHD